jgi:hypothetical protein
MTKKVTIRLDPAHLKVLSRKAKTLGIPLATHLRVILEKNSPLPTSRYNVQIIAENPDREQRLDFLLMIGDHGCVEPEITIDHAKDQVFTVKSWTELLEGEKEFKAPFSKQKARLTAVQLYPFCFGYKIKVVPA